MSATQKVLTFIAREFGNMTLASLLTNAPGGRSTERALTRSAAMWVLNREWGLEPIKIRNAFTAKSVAVVRYTVGTFDQRMDDDPRLQRRVQNLIFELQLEFLGRK